MAAVESHMGEPFIRSRFSEYTNRFIRLAARWEQENIGSTKTHYRSRSYQAGQLGSGITFSDDAAKAKEFSFNSGRIDGWRRTRSYAYWQEVSRDVLCALSARSDFFTFKDFNKSKSEFDLSYQVSRLRHGKDVPEGEIEAIFATIAASLQTYEQVIELLALLPPHHGGLMPLALGLFHPNRRIQDATLVIFDKLAVYQVS